MAIYRFAIDSERYVVANLGTRSPAMANDAAPANTIIKTLDIDASIAENVHPGQGWWIDNFQNLRQDFNDSGITLRHLLDQWITVFRQHHHNLDIQQHEYSYSAMTRDWGHNRLTRHERGIWRLIHSTTLHDSVRRGMLQVYGAADITSADEWWARANALGDRTTDGVFCELSHGVIRPVNVADTKTIDEFAGITTLVGVRGENEVPSRLFDPDSWSDVPGM